MKPLILRRPPQPRPIPRTFPDDPYIKGHHDCGSGHDFGICPACKRGHGFSIRLTAPKPSR